MDLPSCTRSTSALLTLSLLLTLPYWLLQMMRHGNTARDLRQRFGAVPRALVKQDQRPRIWIHAVSVGEVVASSAVIRALQRSSHPIAC